MPQQNKALVSPESREFVPKFGCTFGVNFFRGPRMGRWIHRRWICVLGCPDLQSGGPKPWSWRVSERFGAKIWGPPNADPTTTGPTPHSWPSEVLRGGGKRVLMTKMLPRRPTFSILIFVFNDLDQEVYDFKVSQDHRFNSFEGEWPCRLQHPSAAKKKQRAEAITIKSCFRFRMGVRVPIGVPGGRVWGRVHHNFLRPQDGRSPCELSSQGKTVISLRL